MLKSFLIQILIITSLFSSQNSNFEKGELLEKSGDIKEAINYYFIAANERDNKALLKLGKFYYKGEHLKQSTSKAIDFFEKSTLLGNDTAKYNLAIIYASKQNPKYLDYNKSYKLFLELAQKGNPAAQNKVGMFLTHGYGGIEKDYIQAVKWYEESAKQCYEDAECNLAYMYVNGKGVWKNFGRAHVFAKNGYQHHNPICKHIWKKHSLFKYPEDKSFKLDFFVKPCDD